MSGRPAVPQRLSEPAVGRDRTEQTWHCKATRERVMLMRGRESYVWAY